MRRLRKGRPHRPFDHLGGTWYATWETTVEGRANVNREVLVIRASRFGLAMRNVTPSLENQIGGYLWRGQLALQHNVAIGSYEAVEPHMRYAGSLYYVVHSSGNFMYGRWVGLSFDSELASGLSVLARSPDVSEEQFTRLKDRPCVAVEGSRRSLLPHEE